MTERKQQKKKQRETDIILFKPIIIMNKILSKEQKEFSTLLYVLFIFSLCTKGTNSSLQYHPFDANAN
jgi:hypothetical protein